MSRILSPTVLLCAGMLLAIPEVGAQTIQSTMSGGRWNTPATWVGGVVPGASNAVVVRATVELDVNPTVTSLVVEPGAVLQNESSWFYSITVTGATTNTGTIRSHPSGGSLTLAAQGNVANNGVMAPARLNLTGDASPLYLSQAVGTAWETPITFAKTSGTVNALADLHFTQEVNLAGQTLDMSSYAMAFTGVGRLLNGVVLNAGGISQQGGGTAFANYVRFTGAPILSGTVELGYDIVFDGPQVVNNGILENWNGWTYSAHVHGDVINNGTIRNHPGGIQLNLYVSGDIANYGVWANQLTILDGTGDQLLRQSPGATFATIMDSQKSSGVMSAGSNLRFSKQVELRDDTLDMRAYPLAVEGAGHLGSGTVLNAGSVTQGNSTNPFADYTRFVGSPTTIEGTVHFGYELRFEGELRNEGTIQNASNWSYTAYVAGRIINNGTIRNNPAGNTLAVRVTGDLVNNGTWGVLTYLEGTGDQTMSQAPSTTWAATLISAKPSGYIRAGSSLDFSDQVSLDTDTMMVGPHDLTIRGIGHLANGRIFSDGSVSQINAAGPAMDYTHFTGNVTIRESVNLGYENVFNGTLTVEGTLQNWYGWTYTFYSNGALIINGTVRNHPDGNALTLRTSGDVTNNGTIALQSILLNGTGGQAIAQGGGTAWNSPITSLKPSGVITAGSSLDFARVVELNGDTLDVGTNNLVLRNGGQVRNGWVLLSGDLSQFDAETPAMEYAQVVGTVTVRESVSLGYENTFRGPLTVAGILQNWPGWSYTAYVRGDLVNDGTIRNHPTSGALVLRTFGDLVNRGSWAPAVTYIQGDGPRTLDLATAGGPFVMVAGRILLQGENVLPNLTTNGDAFPLLMAASTLRVLDGSIPAWLANFGEVVMNGTVSSGGTFSWFRTRFTLPATATNTLTLRHFGNQVPATFGNAVRSWWRVETDPASTQPFGSLTLYYDDDQVGSNDEAALHVFRSTDHGETWTQVSASANVTRDTASNWVRMDGAPASGDYVLSSSPNPVSVMPSLVVTVVGRSQIRVGPPNQYLVYYANNSDLPTGDFLMGIETAGGVHIQKILPGAPLGVIAEPIYPKDFAFVPDDDPGPYPDEVALLFVERMMPREERFFTVVLTAIPDPPGKRTGTGDLGSVAIDPVVTTTVGVAWGLGTADSFVSDYIANSVSNYVAGEDRHRLPEEARSAWQRTREQRTTNERAAVGAFKTLLYGVVIWTNPLVGILVIAADKGLAVLRGVLEGSKRNLDIYNATKNLEKVTSWDPNEKVGPGGYGPQGFVTSAGRMTYQILFENKKEATAPAWRITIDDTLSTAFDPSTVRFEGSSHTGWTFTRDGARLRWMVEGIELPPNVNPPEGEGFVQFSVETVPGLPSGTEIRNRAVIVFDLNPPIMTNAVVNTLDFGAPSTVMQAPPAAVTGGPLTLRWTSTDGPGESGVHSTTVYASVDGGGFNPIGTSTADTLAIDAIPGHQYRFYALSRDAVGNAEATLPAIVTTEVISGVDVEPGEGPYVFALDANYPNPFNPVTTIRYSLPEAAPVRLVVFDATGRRVATLVDSTLPAGRHAATWDASALASGVYFYRLQQGSRVLSRPMVLVK